MEEEGNQAIIGEKAVIGRMLAKTKLSHISD
jgi:hypothetical protein